MYRYLVAGTPALAAWLLCVYMFDEGIIKMEVDVRCSVYDWLSASCESDGWYSMVNNAIISHNAFVVMYNTWQNYNMFYFICKYSRLPVITIFFQ